MPNIAEMMDKYIFKEGKPIKVLVRYYLNGYVKYEYHDYQRAISGDFEYGAIDLYE